MNILNKINKILGLSKQINQQKVLQIADIFLDEVSNTNSISESIISEHTDGNEKIKKCE